jgi:hypothetical protein
MRRQHPASVQAFDLANKLAGVQVAFDGAYILRKMYIDMSTDQVIPRR